MSKINFKIFYSELITRLQVQCSVAFILLLLMVHGGLFSQPLPIIQEKQTKDGFEAARNLYDQKLYPDALQLFLAIIATDPDNSNLNFLIGDCMLNISGYEKDALPYMQKAIRNVIIDYENLPQQRKAPVFAFEKLGDLYYQDYNFDQALTDYRSFKAYLDVKKDKILLDKIARKIEITTTARQLVDNPLKLTLTELPFVNVFSYNDYGAKLSSDGTIIYFTRKRISSGGNPGTSDVYYMKKTEGKWGRPVRMPFINTEDDDEFCWISNEDNEMIISSNRDGKFHLYKSIRKGKSQWSIPVPLSSNVNSKNEEKFGCVSSDGKVLYFVSDRKGGLGGKDIYKSTRIEGGDWSPGVNLGPKVNTTLDEDAPFITRDGKTLYFSSEGFKTMGGFDVFFVTLNAANTWSDPINAGYPINTIGDDLYFNRSFKGKPDYFVSRSKPNSNDLSISVLNVSEAAATLSEIKSKDLPKEKTKLKLVPKTLKY